MSSQYELQNFLNSSSDYDDTHSPFVLTSEQPQNNTLTPNPSPDSIVDKVNTSEQISPVDSIKESKSISDDEIKEKLMHMKTDPDKGLSIPTTDSAAIENANIANALDISIKSEHLSAEMDMVLESNPLNDSNFLNSPLDNIFGEGENELNETETKMSFESNDPNKKSDNDRKNEKNMNESSDSDSDDTDDDSDDSDDSDDDESTENSENEEEDDETSDVEQKKHSPNKNSEGKSKKSNTIDDIHDETDSKCLRASESLEKILSADLSAENSRDQMKSDDHDKSGDTSRKSPKHSDKLGMGVDGMDRPFGLQRADDNNRTDNLPNDSTMMDSDMVNDNHSNISGSDAGDFGDDVDDSSNDSAKSSNSHAFARLTNKSNDVPMKSDNSNIESCIKSDMKSGNNDQSPYTMTTVFDDLNTSDTSDSAGSEKGSSMFNLMRDCGSKGLEPNVGQREHDGQQKSSPNTDIKLKSVSSCIGLSVDSAIGSKCVEDDNAMSDLHTDNISDDEYDIKPDSITARKAENISIRSNENFESIANYISPAPMSLNTLISADYSNLSDNNDTSSNDNRDSGDNKRNENSPNMKSMDGLDRITDKDIMEPGELLGKNLLESQDSNLTSESISGDNNLNKTGKSPFSAENSGKEKMDSGGNPDGSDIHNVDGSKKSDDATNTKSEFSSLLTITAGDGSDVSNSSKNPNANPESRNQGDGKQKTDDEMVFSFNFLGDHSMHDSNQSGILGEYLSFLSISCPESYIFSLFLANFYLTHY